MRLRRRRVSPTLSAEGARYDGILRTYTLSLLPISRCVRLTDMPGMNAHDAGSAGESSGDTRTAQQIIDATRAQLSWMEAAESEVRSSF